LFISGVCDTPKYENPSSGFHNKKGRRESALFYLSINVVKTAQQLAIVSAILPRRAERNEKFCTLTDLFDYQYDIENEG
jgi:hypothetical protein